jgi:hypothetical protein
MRPPTRYDRPGTGEDDTCLSPDRENVAQPLKPRQIFPTPIEPKNPLRVSTSGDSFILKISIANNCDSLVCLIDIP